jgi:MFS family permease
VLSSLRFRNFRLLWIGLGVSFTGTFVQQTAILWHVSLLVPPGQKGLALGLVGLVRAVPVIIFSLIAGLAADVIDRWTLMLATQIGGTIVAVLLAALAFAHVQVVWPLYVLAAAGAAIGAFDPPSRQSMVAMLVPRHELSNAISLSTAMMQTASVAGPAAAGLLIAQSSVGWAYVVDAVSFSAVIVALLLMRDVPKTDRSTVHARDQFSIAAIREGLSFVFREPVVRSTMLIDFFATFFASATALLPIFAQDILHVGATGYGLLSAAPAVGAVLATVVMMAIAPRIARQGVLLLWAVVAYGLATIAFGVSTAFWMAFVVFALTGAADAVSTVIRNVMRQLETPDAMRGRMVGVNMVFFMGGPQLGELEAGLAAQWIGARLSVVTGGVGCLIATAVIAAVTPALTRYRPNVSRPVAEAPPADPVSGS